MTDINPNKLRDAFASKPLSSNPSIWHSLYQQSYTPWDRTGPSLALADLLAQRTDLIPPPSSDRRSALVPGCGPGHDALLLAERGYDVVGLDLTDLAIQRAVENEKKAVLAEGGVTWRTGDFFDDSWREGLPPRFDLIFDYTFLCALQPDLRPKWAQRMAQLLAPGGHLICLEYPSGKPLSEAGPPWGLWPEVYEALLAAPGEPVQYRDDGTVSSGPEPGAPHPDALHRLCLVKPQRTHKAGTNDDGSVRDFISVYSR